MNETLTLVLASLAGVAIGVIFFGGLWLTVRKGVTSKQPALWFFCSAVARTAITLGGFYFVSGYHYERLLCCLVGFFISGLTGTCLSALPAANQPRPAAEVDNHAH